MANFLTKLIGLGDPLSNVVTAIDKLTTTGEERAEVRAKLVEKLVDAQSAVLVAEASSGGALARSWRPLVMLSFASILIYTFFIAPMFNLRSVELPPDLWTLLQVGLGGYIGGRSVEKIVGMLPLKGKAFAKMEGQSS